jgi:hypothetical protein
VHTMPQTSQEQLLAPAVIGCSHVSAICGPNS